MITTDTIAPLTDTVNGTPAAPATPATATEFNVVPPAAAPVAPNQGNKGMHQLFADAAAEMKSLIADKPGDWIADGLEADAQKKESGDQWVRDDKGRFASPEAQADGDATTAPATEGAPAEGTVAADPAAPAIAEPAAPEVPVEVIAIPDRNGQTLELEVSDPRHAEALRMLLNDGMRKEEFLKQLAPVQEERRQFKAFLSELKAAPESAVQLMTPEAQVRALKILIANNFDAAKEIAQTWYEDDTQRRSFLVDTREQEVTRRQQVQAEITVDSRASDLATAIDKLIPAWATKEDYNDFYTAAAAHVTAVDQARKGNLTPEEIPALLARDVRRYGFDKPTADAPAAPPTAAPNTPAVAAPSGAKAEELANRARVSMARMKSVTEQQKAVAASAPAGAGTAPVVRPPITSWADAAARVQEHYKSQGLR